VKSIAERRECTFEDIDNLVDDMSAQEGRDFLLGLLKRYGRIYKYLKGQASLKLNDVSQAADQSDDAA
jgi:hypothetical protein